MASSSKRPRLDQPSNIFDESLTDFKEIATNHPDMLVDKTELIHIFCTQGEKCELVTAPPRFGKTVNLTMLKYFFMIEVDPKTGILKTQLDPQRDAITDTENYRLFSSLNLAIMEYPDIVQQYLGRHPVLYVDFKCHMGMHEIVDGVEHCKTVMHETYKQYEYLSVSEQLTDGGRAIVKKWCSDEYRKMKPNHALKQLEQYLYKHFNRDVVLLVDNYDSSVINALVDANGAYQIKKICRGPIYLFAEVLKINKAERCLLKSLVTGIFDVLRIGWTYVASYIKLCRFTQCHKFNQYYGFQSKEVEDLVEKFVGGSGFEVEKQKTLDIIKAWYSGYEYPGRPGERMYCPWAVLNYLRTGTSSAFWVGGVYIKPLRYMFWDDKIQEFLIKLLERNGTGSLSIMYKWLSNELSELKRYPKGVKWRGIDVLFLNFILELGYLTVKSNAVKIANNEVRLMMLGGLRDYYKEKYSQEFKESVKKKSKEILNCIRSAADPNVSDDEFKKALQWFKQEMETLFQQFSHDCLPVVNEAALHCFMAEIITAGDLHYTNEYYVLDSDPFRSRLDVLGYGNQFALLVELKNLPTSRKSALEALNQILDKEYFNVFEYPKLLASNIKSYVLMGVTVSEDKKMAVSAVRNYQRGVDCHRIHLSFRD